jgi:bifunctional pyridoxal-dependent enzyme with beta-cystathionase and maltose regulon repressor activities
MKLRKKLNNITKTKKRKVWMQDSRDIRSHCATVVRAVCCVIRLLRRRGDSLVICQI